MIVQHGGFAILFQLEFNKIYPISVTNIAETTYAIFLARLCKEYARTKINNAPGVHLCQNVSLCELPPSPPEKKTGLEPAIQGKHGRTAKLYLKIILIIQHEVPFINTREATKRVERPKRKLRVYKCHES